jgi:hypothetical protein
LLINDLSSIALSAIRASDMTLLEIFFQYETHEACKGRCKAAYKKDLQIDCLCVINQDQEWVIHQITKDES